MTKILDKRLKIVTIGGGTGSFTLLNAFKSYFTNITAIVNMADDGGSTGQLRDELGVLPPGDVRQCLIALSSASELRDLFSYRFSEGSLHGQSFGNLFLSAAEKVSKDFESAVELASNVLRITGKVVPVTLGDSKLVLKWPDGQEVRGEYIIGHLDFEHKTKPTVRYEPQVRLTDAAAQAISEADFVIIAPGNLYASLASVLSVDGMLQALSNTDADVVYACNLVTKPGQTDNFKVHDYAAEIERFAGAPILDYVLYNTDRPEPEILDKYIHARELLVGVDERELERAHYKSIGLPLIAHDFVRPSGDGDIIAATRSFIRHDANAVAAAILKIAS